MAKNKNNNNNQNNQNNNQNQFENVQNNVEFAEDNEVVNKKLAKRQMNEKNQQQ